MEIVQNLKKKIVQAITKSTLIRVNRTVNLIYDRTTYRPTETRQSILKPFLKYILRRSQENKILNKKSIDSLEINCYFKKAIDQSHRSKTSINIPSSESSRPKSKRTFHLLGRGSRDRKKQTHTHPRGLGVEGLKARARQVLNMNEASGAVRAGAVRDPEASTLSTTRGLVRHS